MYPDLVLVLGVLPDVIGLVDVVRGEPLGFFGIPARPGTVVLGLDDWKKLYGLFKQAEQGDAPPKGPSRLHAVAHAKWAAWAALRGTGSASSSDQREQAQVLLARGGTFGLLFVALLLLFALLADYLVRKVERMSERVAPMMILLTFMQTTTLLLDVPLSWPRVLRDLFKLLSIVNLNIELARPECVFDINDNVRE